MQINFSEQLAIDFDLEVEYFLRNIVGWIVYNAAKDNPKNRNFHENQYWTHNSYPEYAKLIPVFSKKQIRTVSSRAIKGGLLKIGHFNKKKYDNTNWYTLTIKGWNYFEKEAKKLYPEWFDDHRKIDGDLNTPAQMGTTPAQMGRPIPINPNSLRDIIISDLEKSHNDDNEKMSGYSGDCHNVSVDRMEDVDSTGNKLKSDYQKNQSEKEAGLSKNEHSSKSVKGSRNTSSISREDQEIIDAYHELLPNSPKIKRVDQQFSNQLKKMRKNWPEYQKDGKEFSIESFKDYLNYLKRYYSWFVKPYTTTSGNLRCNNLRVITRDINITKIVNGEFSAN